MNITSTRDQQAAISAVTQAARLCATVRAEMAGAQYSTKSDQSPVTVADYGAQALICRHLSTHFPRDSIVAEESAAALRNPDQIPILDLVTHYVRKEMPDATPGDVCDWIDAGSGRPQSRFWTLDPIDGTKGFLRNDQYAVALALIEDGEVRLGVLACPALPASLDEPTGDTGVLFVAARGQGAQVMPLRGGAMSQVRVARDAANRRLVESVEAAHGNHELQEAIAQAVGIAQPGLRMDSQAKYAVVARGDAVLYLRLPSPKSPDYREAIWDHAAGTLIVEEAGGQISDISGKPLDFAVGARLHANRGVVVSGGIEHQRVLDALYNYLS